ncbi:MAG TPA: SH3 domain-containing protein [Roseiflexaceae bacterium]|nr:SH3 domain-containing protein [Roseiflexaceae bacterium]
MQYEHLFLITSVASNPAWIALGLFVLGLLLLEIERLVIRGRRRRGLRDAGFARVLDALALLTWLAAGVLVIVTTIWPAMQRLSAALLVPIAWSVGLVAILAAGGWMLRRVAQALPRSSEPVSAATSLVPAAQLNSAQSVAFTAPALTPTNVSGDRTRIPAVPAGYETPFPPSRQAPNPAPTSPVRARIQAQLQAPRQDYLSTQVHMRWFVGILAFALLIALVLVVGTSGWAFQYPRVPGAVPQSTIINPLPRVQATEELAIRRVKDTLVAVRVNPGANQPVIQTLPAGTEVRVLPEERLIRASVWVKVRVGVIEGWVSQSALE